MIRYRAKYFNREIHRIVKSRLFEPDNLAVLVRLYADRSAFQVFRVVIENDLELIPMVETETMIRLSDLADVEEANFEEA